jgi:hypothetical protein
VDTSFILSFLYESSSSKIAPFWYHRANKIVYNIIEQIFHAVYSKNKLGSIRNLIARHPEGSPNPVPSDSDIRVYAIRVRNIASGEMTDLDNSGSTSQLTSTC